jgi:hypothetical protein
VSLKPLEAFIVVHHWQLNFPASNKEIHVGQREQALLLSFIFSLSVHQRRIAAHRRDLCFITRVSILDTFRRFESRDGILKMCSEMWRGDGGKREVERG